MRREFAEIIAAHSWLFAVPAWGAIGWGVCSRDPADKQFLALAQVAGAGAIISSDQVLLALDPRGQVRIAGANEFLMRWLG